MNSIQRQIQQLNNQIGFIVNSIQRQIQQLNPQVGFNVNSIQRQIQPLNPQNGFNVNSIQTVSTIKPSNRIQCQFHSKTDPTIKLLNRI